LPKSRLDFWKPKLERNRERDLENQAKLKKLGWQVMVIWECEIRGNEQLRNKIKTFLEENG
jgi:DNA mismatch endonuclease (patch repair protein)